jgi:gluconolactonase
MEYRVIAATIERTDPAINDLIPYDAQLEVLGRGFGWSEGPVWIPGDNALLFTDIPGNTIYRWREYDGVQVFLRPSGLVVGKPLGNQMGANGLALDQYGHILMCDHGNRCVARLNLQDFTKSILARSYRELPLNSPNDLVCDSRGNIYFTDPPYGLAGGNDDPAKMQDINGVFLIRPYGEVILITGTLSAPNGVVLSHDEKTLFVSNSDPDAATWSRIPLAENGLRAGEPEVFFDATPVTRNGRPGLPDGMTLDRRGNLFATGPGGVHVFGPNGTHLGGIVLNQPTSNCTFDDEGYLYITGSDFLYRIRLLTGR